MEEKSRIERIMELFEDRDTLRVMLYLYYYGD